jgi:hypothetical protein
MCACQEAYQHQDGVRARISHTWHHEHKDPMFSSCRPSVRRICVSVYLSLRFGQVTNHTSKVNFTKNTRAYYTHLITFLCMNCAEGPMMARCHIFVTECQAWQCMDCVCRFSVNTAISPSRYMFACTTHSLEAFHACT